MDPTSDFDDEIATNAAPEADGAFVMGQVAYPEIEQVPILNEELVFATKLKVETLDALTYPTLLVFRPGCTYRIHLEQVLHECGLAPRKIMEFESLEAILVFLGRFAAGMGIAMFPRSTIAKLQYTDKVKMHPIPTAAARVPTMFIRRHDTVCTRVGGIHLDGASDGDGMTRGGHDRRTADIWISRGQDSFR